MRTALICSAFALAAVAAAAPAQAPSAAVTAAVAAKSRPAEDTARDAARKPAAAIAFSGLKPGDRVADLVPGGGYFTRLFAAVVGPKGRVYGAVPSVLAARPGFLDGINAVARAHPNVSVLPIDFATLPFPEKLDMVWTSENYHDFLNTPNADPVGFNREVFAALKPGGTYVVEDHAAAAGAGTSVTRTLHRIDPAAVIRDVEAAGFKLEARSDLLANPADPHTAAVFDPAIRGRSDKFLLRFRKPK